MKVNKNPNFKEYDFKDPKSRQKFEDRFFGGELVQAPELSSIRASIVVEKPLNNIASSSAPNSNNISNDNANKSKL